MQGPSIGWPFGIPRRELALFPDRWSPRTVFRLDAAGALVTASAVGLVLPRFSAPLALDVSTLHQLGVAALLLFAWGAVVLTTRPAAWSRALRILAACNMAYLLLTWVLLMRLPARPALLALAYFAGEALVVGVLAAAEWRYARRHEGREFLR